MKIGIIGLGYVGLPIALLLSKKNIKVIGYDINKVLIKKLKDGTYGANNENGCPHRAGRNRRGQVKAKLIRENG